MLNLSHYSKEAGNWIDDSSGEIFVQDSDLEFLKQQNNEKRNYRDLSYFFKKEGKKFKVTQK